MYNAANKLAAMAVGALGLLTACNGSNAEVVGSEALLASADSAIKCQNYNLALEMLDTLKSRYPRQLEAQRDGMHLRPIAIEGATIRELESTDSLRSLTEHRRDSLLQQFVLVDNPDLVEGYWVVKSRKNASLFNTSGIEARISPDGQFYIISSLVGHPSVKHTSVSLRSAAGEVSSATVGYDGDRNYRSGDTEMITFVGAECDTLGHFLAANPQAKVTLVFKGEGGSHSMSLSEADRKAVALTYEAAQAVDETRRLGLKVEKLDKQLVVARDQIARTQPDDGSLTTAEE